ncbi:thiopeptide maturation pyridine synthase [Kitasatospora sp. NPDC058170]|uniref:thiopeptide maturation pyridine synthase n=1 Tax=Kitasatospora sp. NPDC058170 TaxID=3346364 RepID=UPI0036DBC161
MTSTTATTAARWRSIQVRYYAEDKDDLVLDAVRPLFRRFAGEIGRPYLTRHWRRGPHLRLDFTATEEDWQGTVLPGAQLGLAEYLLGSPSTAVLDQRAHFAAHQRMARAQDEQGPLFPWHPDNSLQTEPHDDRSHVLGSRQLADLLDDAYAASCEQLFTMLERVRGGHDSRRGIALDLMFAFARVSGQVSGQARARAGAPPAGRGFGSYRAHTERFLTHCRNPSAVRAALDVEYRARRPALERRLTAVLETLDGDGQVPFVRWWARHTAEVEAAAEPLLESGRISLDRGGAPPAEPPQGQPPAGGPAAAVDLLLLDPAHPQEVLAGVRHQSHRIAANVLCSHLDRLGIGPRQRFVLCHLAASTAEDLFGIPAPVRGRACAAPHPAPRPVRARSAPAGPLPAKELR